MRFLCGMCTYSTDDDKAFLTHYGDQHKREMAYWCRECGRTFTSPAQLVVHIKTSCTKVKSVTMRCGVTGCTFSGMDPFQFMQHIKIVHKGTHLFPCFKCRKLFTIPSCLIQHIQTECAEADKNTTARQKKPSSRSDQDERTTKPMFSKNSFTYERKSKVVVQCSDDDSDPDDPVLSDSVSFKSNKSKLDKTNLQSDIEIHSPFMQIKRKNSSQQEEFVAKKRRTSEEVVTGSFPHQTHPQRYERWSDWWKAVSACKSPSALESLLREDNLRHFFACMSYSCHYSTNDEADFAKHQSNDHPGQKLPCRYCLREIEAGSALAEHSVSSHGTRRHQCSRCLYRASTKSQVALHFEAMHGGKPIIFGCEAVGPEPEVAESTETEVAMPYICRVGRCKYETCNPEEFIAHNRQAHTGVSVYPCFYCGAETFKLDALMRHYRLHGIYNFQCAHCVHGTNTIEEILFHQCLNHAERRMQVYIRPSSSNSPRNEAQQELENEQESPSYPDYRQDHARNFACGVEGCHQVLCGLESYREHLLASHHCNSFFPCPYCTAISVTAVNLEDHLTTHGPNLYACGVGKCPYFHWKKSTVELHCQDKHDEVVITIIREGTEEDINKVIKKEPEEYQESEKNPENSILPCNSYQEEPLNGTDSNSGIGGDPIAFATENKSCTETRLPLATESEFVCPFCKYTAAFQEDMQEHLYEELEYTAFHCNFCKVKGVSLSHIQTHTADSHPSTDSTGSFSEVRNESLDSWVAIYLRGDCRRWQKSRSSSDGCVLCGASVFPIEKMEQHLADHLCYKPHACLFCDKKFFGREESRAHALTYHSASEGPFASCSPIARIEKWLRETSESAKRQTSAECLRKIYKCYYCNFGPSTLKAQKEHFAELHWGKKLRLRKLTSSPALASSSIRQKSPSTSCSIVCEKCGHVMNLTNSSLKRAEGFSSYGKKTSPFEWNGVWVAPPQDSCEDLRIPVEDFMKIMNFNVLLQLTDLSKTLYRKSP